METHSNPLLSSDKLGTDMVGFNLEIHDAMVKSASEKTALPVNEPIKTTEYGSWPVVIEPTEDA